MNIFKTYCRCRYGLKSILILEDGSIYYGCGFGIKGEAIGELVFSTSIVGYPELITDPSYAGQILVLTHPLIGNYGIASKDININGIPLHFESDKIWVEGLIVHELTIPNHWTSIKNLHEWFVEEKKLGMYCIDTRHLVKKIREKGVMMALLKTYDVKDNVDVNELFEKLKKSEKYDNIDFVKKVTINKEVVYHGEKKITIGIIDCGIKYGILRELINRKCTIIRYPAYTSIKKIVNECNGVIISNGPGNPAILKNIIENIRKLIEYKIPILGICLGHQLIVHALNGKTYKLKYGHRGSNKPVKDLITGKCYITTQNHGFAVDFESIKNKGFKLWFINIDDYTVEGLKHEKLPIISVQFHPEASPGPYDTSWIFTYYFKKFLNY